MSQTTASIRYIKDKDDEVFFPVAHEKGVVDSSGTTLETKLGQKQDTLVSGTSIKTINNESILGSGNITVQTSITTDATPTSGSTNPVQSGGVYTALSGKQQSISSVNVTVDNNTGTPSATASVSGSTMSIAFSNIKGGQGEPGSTPEFSVGTVSTLPAGSQATVSITGTSASPILNLGIPTGATGAQGNTGSSVDYPYELVNNLTTDDATKGLSAAQGVVLEGEISQLALDVPDIAKTKWYEDHFRSLLEVHISHNGNGTYGANNQRNAIRQIQHLDYPITISVDSSHKFALQFYDSTEGGTSHYTGQGGWYKIDSPQTISAGTYWGMILAGDPDKTTTEADNLGCFFAVPSNVVYDEVSEIPGLVDAVGLYEGPMDISDYTVVTGVYVNGVYQANTKRGCFLLPIAGITKMTIRAATGYRIAATLYSGYPASNNIVWTASEWATSSSLDIPEGAQYLTCNIIQDQVAEIPGGPLANYASLDIYEIGIQQQIAELKNEIAGPIDKSGDYHGERISLNGYPFKREIFTTIPNKSTYSQSFAIYGDYIVYAYGAPNFGTGSLWRLSTKTKIADLTFAHGNYNVPHGNVINFGSEFASGNTDLPLLYLSQWDGEGGCLVYNLQADGTISLVQAIMVSGMDSTIYGSNNGDWVVDTESGAIWSVHYLINDASVPGTSGNRMCFCKYVLPTLSDGSSITFTPSDILEHFQTDMMLISQDKIVYNGRMFIIAGWSNTTDYLYVVDLRQKSIVSRLSLNQWGSEPEGLSIYNDGENHLLYDYGTDALYELSFYE